MITLDILIAVFLLFGLIRGIFKGLFVEIASTVALIAGIYGAYLFSGTVAGYLKTRINWDENTIKITAFAITFAIIVLVISLSGKLLTKIAGAVHLGWVNKIAGGAFGLLKKALILSALFLVLEKFDTVFPVIGAKQKEQSVLYLPVKNILPEFFPGFSGFIKQTGVDEIKDKLPGVPSGQPEQGNEGEE